MNGSKPWYKSKTILVSVLTLAAGLLGVVAGSDLIAQNPQAVAWATSALGAVNFTLRWVTSDAIEASSDEN